MDASHAASLVTPSSEAGDNNTSSSNNNIEDVFLDAADAASPSGEYTLPAPPPALPGGFQGGGNRGSAIGSFSPIQVQREPPQEEAADSPVREYWNLSGDFQSMGNQPIMSTPIHMGSLFALSYPMEVINCKGFFFRIPVAFLQTSPWWRHVLTTFPRPPTGWELHDLPVQVLSLFFTVSFSTFALEGIEPDINLLMLLNALWIAERWQCVDTIEKLGVSIYRYIGRTILHHNPHIPDLSGALDSAYFEYRSLELYRAWKYVSKIPELSNTLSPAQIVRLFYFVIPEELWAALTAAFHDAFCYLLHLCHQARSVPIGQEFREFFISWFIMGSYFDQSWLGRDDSVERERETRLVAWQLSHERGVLQPSFDEIRAVEAAGIAARANRPPAGTTHRLRTAPMPAGHNPLRHGRHNSCPPDILSDVIPVSADAATQLRRANNDRAPLTEEAQAMSDVPQTEDQFELKRLVVHTTSQQAPPLPDLNTHNLPLQDADTRAPDPVTPENQIWGFRYYHPAPHIPPAQPQLPSHFSVSTDSDEGAVIGPEDATITNVPVPDATDTTVTTVTTTSAGNIDDTATETGSAALIDVYIPGVSDYVLPITGTVHAPADATYDNVMDAPITESLDNSYPVDPTTPITGLMEDVCINDFVNDAQEGSAIRDLHVMIDGEPQSVDRDGDLNMD